MALWHATLLGAQPPSQSEARIERAGQSEARTDQEDTRPRETVIKFRRRGKSIVKARGQGQLGPGGLPGHMFRAQGGKWGWSGLRCHKSVRSEGQVSRHSLWHCEGDAQLGLETGLRNEENLDKIPVNRTWLETGNCQNKQWSVPFAVWEVWNSSSANQRPAWRECDQWEAGDWPWWPRPSHPR